MRLVIPKNLEIPPLYSQSLIPLCYSLYGVILTFRKIIYSSHLSYNETFFLYKIFHLPDLLILSSVFLLYTKEIHFHFCTPFKISNVLKIQQRNISIRQFFRDTDSIIFFPFFVLFSLLQKSVAILRQFIVHTLSKGWINDFFTHSLHSVSKRLC